VREVSENRDISLNYYPNFVVDLHLGNPECPQTCNQAWRGRDKEHDGECGIVAVSSMPLAP